MASFALQVPGSISIVYIAQSSVKVEKHAFLSSKGDGENSWDRAGMLEGVCLSLHFDGHLSCSDLSPRVLTCRS